jgi:hypothetical protein
MTLWRHWWNAVFLLRPAFSRLRSFLWFVTAVAGLTVRPELLGVTSIVRALSLKPVFYGSCSVVATTSVITALVARCA